jgi:two-component system sensor histidine kinase KdpD
MEDREESVQHFLDLIKRSRRGKFKIYIGMIAGVGKVIVCCKKLTKCWRTV